MISTIAWLDSTPEEQRVTRELVALFSQTESRDELGIGQVRDAFSDLLFPGTSVLQTRARYYLFVPWCYTSGRAAHAYEKENFRVGQLQERQLIKTFQDSAFDDAAGLIGSRVGPEVKNLPSTLYWSGMLTYKVRTNPGAIGSAARRSGGDSATELSERVVGEWDPGIPPAPPRFPSEVPGGFVMTPAEAEWLCGRMVAAAPDTVLAHLLNRHEVIGDDLRYPWHAAPPSEFESLHHAEWFSAVIEGAPLLYNLLIGEQYELKGFDHVPQPVETYRTALTRWHSDFSEQYGTSLAAWDVDRMWELAIGQNPNIGPSTRSFIDSWIAGVREGASPADHQGLRELVRIREKRKGSQSRLVNEKLLASWSGSAGVGRLAYRWGNVRTVTNDILRGLHAGA